MSHYNTGIENIPSLFDLASALTGFVADFAQVVLGSTQTSFKAAALEDDDLGKYDPTARSWEGTGGLHYRVPLYPIPSERHTRDKTRNIRVLMDNCRHLCVKDELPSTKEEMQFWTAYRFMKYQMYLAPMCIIMPPLYIFWRMFHDRIPRPMRGRTIPITLSLALAEQWADATYPGHQLLSTALKAKTPMGDAARAEWLRLQPIDMPYYIYTAYQFQHFFGNTPAALQFGGDAASLCS
ncbi:hypothetical protein TraAM80_02848 [Trypanosoma rangeli]|uniref:Uncharacterized protein n=1 Tax=Trypanosoma rangeli TaxID=5698 RepID=A0A422NSE3_TRYRA|nr:uncharacterized protein TraAM80_02848 [Trypanosoma rangeli]RNF08388.1 hypothetical protein TraAM80_02848 [Trypanosoma rangeli]|eukprot:RNF08388.1 hypothetical protein TraAM80_02848 [Trypanosoma rangeli]